VINATLGNQSLLPYVFLNHFTAYQLAVGLLLGLITGGFALIKSRNMFAKGNRYFLFACVGNWPFSWVIEDFTYFLFNPLDALSSTHWSTWFMGGVYAYSPWMPGHPKPEFFIPTWYFLAFAWFLGCQWYAHRCTVYDATIKDELGQEILPKPLPTPIIPTPTSRPPRFHWLRKKLSRRKVSPTPIPIPLPVPEIEKHEPPHPIRVPRSVPKVQPSQTTETPLVPKVTKGTSVTPSSKPRSPDAEAALKRMREKWVRANA
jgi:hypothetical protein